MIYINVGDWMSHNRGSATDDEQGFIFRKVESLNLLYMYQLCYSFFLFVCFKYSECSFKEMLYSLHIQTVICQWKTIFQFIRLNSRFLTVLSWKTWHSKL